MRNDGNFESATDTIAARLLRIEQATQEKVEHLRGVQNGILLQALFTNATQAGMLIAKVDWARFLSKGSYKDTDGVDYKPRLLKASLILFGSNNSVKEVHVVDSNSGLSTFWWKDFLELTEIRTDESNTKVVFNTFDTFLGHRLKVNHPADYPRLHNSMLNEFKREQKFSFGGFLNRVFDGYKPSDSKLDVPKLKAAALKLQDKKTFDATFTIRPEIVKRRFKKTYPLTDEIDLQINGSVEKIESVVFGHRLADGRKGVFVRSDRGYAQFLPPAVSKQSKTTSSDKQGQAHQNVSN